MSESGQVVAVTAPHRAHADSGWRPLERLVTVALIALLATLPLEWISLRGVLGGTLKYFHLAALALVAIAAMGEGLGAVTRRALRPRGGVFIWYGLYLGAVGFLGLTHASPYKPTTDLVRETFYVATAVVVSGICAVAIARPPVRRYLAWAGLVTLVVLMSEMTLSLSRQGVNPAGVIGDAIAQQNPDTISYRLLRTTFRSGGETLEDVGANLRHKVFSALLVASFVALSCRGAVLRRSRPLRSSVLWIAHLLVVAVVVLSLSRSIILVLLLTVTLNVLRVVLTSRVRKGNAAALFVLAAIGSAVLVSSVGALLWVRFVSETGSLNARSAALGEFPALVGRAALSGLGGEQVVQSPHIMILDAWLAGGVVGAALMLAASVSFARIWLREARRYLFGQRGWVIPVDQFWIVALGLVPIVRSFTAGSGLHMTEWVAVGVFLGAAEANRRAVAAQSAGPARSGAGNDAAQVERAGWTGARSPSPSGAW